MSLLSSIGGVLGDFTYGFNDPSAAGREREARKRREEESQTRMFEEAKRLEIARAAEKAKEAEQDADTLKQLTSLLGGDAEEAARALAAGKSGKMLTSAIEAIRARGGMGTAEQIGRKAGEAELSDMNAKLLQNRYFSDQVNALTAQSMPEKEAQRKASEAMLGTAVATNGISLVPAETESKRKAFELSSILSDQEKEFAPQGHAVRLGKNAVEAQDIIDAERLRETRRDLNKVMAENQVREALIRGQALTTATGEDGRIIAGMVNPAPSQAYIDMMKGVAEVRANKGPGGAEGPVDPNAALGQSLRNMGFKFANDPANTVPTAKTGSTTGNTGNANNGGKSPTSGFTTAGPNPGGTGALPPTRLKSGGWFNNNPVYQETTY